MKIVIILLFASFVSCYNSSQINHILACRAFHTSMAHISHDEVYNTYMMYLIYSRLVLEYTVEEFGYLIMEIKIDTFGDEFEYVKKTIQK